MRVIKGTTISNEIEEAIYDATDLYGVYEFELDVKLGNVIYVVGVAPHSLPEMVKAQEYLNKRCPEFMWLGALYDWDARISSVPIFTSSVWYGEEGEYGSAD